MKSWWQTTRPLEKMLLGDVQVGEMWLKFQNGDVFHVARGCLLDAGRLEGKGLTFSATPPWILLAGRRKRLFTLKSEGSFEDSSIFVGESPDTLSCCVLEILKPFLKNRKYFLTIFVKSRSRFQDFWPTLFVSKITWVISFDVPCRSGWPTKPKPHPQVRARMDELQPKVEEWGHLRREIQPEPPLPKADLWKGEAVNERLPNKNYRTLFGDSECVT